MSIRHRSRFFPLLAGAALVLAACGDGDSVVTSGGDEPADTEEAALRAPTPIEIVGGASTPNAAAESATADDVALEGTSMIDQIGNVDYVADAELRDLPSADTGYVFEPGATPSDEQIRAVADGLGVSGEITVEDDGYQQVWRVGPGDGSEPSLWVYGDAQLAWNYSGPWEDRPAVECVVAGSPGGPVEEVDAVEVEPGEVVDSSSDGGSDEESLPAPPPDEHECDVPDAPEGVPTVAEAESRVTELLATLGVDTEGLAFESFGDDWFASVTAWDADGPLGQAQQWNFGFGANGVLEYASGQLADPTPVGPYPLVDLDIALARLNESGGWYGASGGPAIASSGVAEPAIAVAPDDVATDDVASEEPMPVEPLDPVDVTVTLVDVQADLLWAWDIDGAAWLLPAYRFIDADGGWHVVPAVTDEFIIEVEELPEPEPLPVDGSTEPAPAPAPEPAPGDLDEVTSVALAHAGLGVDDPAIDEFIGLPQAEFEDAVAAEFGWGPFRVAFENGEWYALTEDLVPGRVSMAIEGGIVTGAVVETDAGMVDPPAPIDEGAAAVIAERHDGVAFYPACGNEVLVHDGVRWYQIQQFEYPEEHQRITGVPREGLEPDLLRTDGAPTGFAAPRVAEPGPGDDVGTLIIWEDGFAMWRSDSGNLVAWLTTTELTYEWEC